MSTLQTGEERPIKTENDLSKNPDSKIPMSNNAHHNSQISTHPTYFIKTTAA